MLKEKAQTHLVFKPTKDFIKLESAWHSTYSSYIPVLTDAVFHSDDAVCFQVSQLRMAHR